MLCTPESDSGAHARGRGFARIGERGMGDPGAHVRGRGMPMTEPIQYDLEFVTHALEKPVDWAVRESNGRSFLLHGHIRRHRVADRGRSLPAHARIEALPRLSRRISIGNDLDQPFRGHVDRELARLGSVPEKGQDACSRAEVGQPGRLGDRCDERQGAETAFRQGEPSGA